MMRDIKSLNSLYILTEEELTREECRLSSICTKITIAGGVALLSAYKTYTVDIKIPADVLLPYLLSILYPGLPVPEVELAQIKFVTEDEKAYTRGWFVGSLSLEYDPDMVDMHVANGNYTTFSKNTASKFIDKIRKDLEK